MAWMHLVHPLEQEVYCYISPNIPEQLFHQCALPSGAHR